MELVLNELSLDAFPQNRSVVLATMENFVLTLKSAVLANLKRTLRTESGIDEIDLMDSYKINQWRNDSSVPKEQRDYLKTIISKSPMLNDLNEKDAKLKFGLVEVKYINSTGNKFNAKGIEFAYVFDFVSISFLVPTDFNSDWNSSKLKIEIQEIIDEAGNINYYSDCIRNISRPQLVEEHSEWIREKINQNLISNPESIWENREQLFPNLIFCFNVEKELKKYSSYMNELKRALYVLNDYALEIKNNPRLDKKKWRIKETSPETQKKYESAYTFVKPDNKKSHFYQHTVIIDSNPSPHRIYFYLEPATSKVFIGYLGHLPTIKYSKLKI